MSDLIRLQNIHKAYWMGPDRVSVLRGVDLSVREGEFVAIMGASGSGKSTLLHIAGALDTPDLGPIGPEGKVVPASTAPEVFFRDQPLSTMGAGGRDHLRTHDFGFVFQFYHLVPELNVLENVLLPAMIDAPAYLALFRARPRKNEALDLIESFGLANRLKHRPSQLSGGERQRVAIARALINNPPLLLADEPTGNLDAKTGQTILDVLLTLHKQKGQTILLVTHDPHVAALADRTIHLADGRIKQPGVANFPGGV
ncbi:MAG TPA: ABC transporter ATP-binding protein [Phycisphaerae bacterium]|nr:ABC transporter ATP-binding protein [Phycisphaerae bacterium]